MTVSSGPGPSHAVVLGHGRCRDVGFEDVRVRLYQAQPQGVVPGGLDQPLWWTLRRPFRQLTYPATHPGQCRAGSELDAS